MKVMEAILNNSTPHSLHIFSCSECPSITFEFVTEQAPSCSEQVFNKLEV